MFKKRNLILYIIRVVLISLLLSFFPVGGSIPATASSGTLTVTLEANDTVRLNWDDNREDILYYVIERKTGAASFYRISYVSEDSTTYIDTLSASYLGEDCTYRILTCIYSYSTYNYDYAYYSNEVTFKAGEVIAPISLNAAPVSHTEIDLDWSYPLNAAFSTLVERREQNSSLWATAAVVPANFSSYEDTGLEENKIYYYRVRAVSGPYLKSTAFPADASGHKTGTLLETPAALTARATSQTQVDLSWNDLSLETSFVIERRLSNEAYIPVRTVAANTTGIHDTGLIPDALYTYRIKAVYEDYYRTNVSAYTKEISVVTSPVNSPGNLKASLTPFMEVRLSWDCAVKYESGFEIWRRQQSSSSWFRIGAASRNDRYFTDSSNAPGILYYYRIRSFISLNNDFSAFTPEVTAGASPVTPPDRLQYRVLSQGRIILEWHDNSINENGFYIEHRPAPDLEWATIAALPANRTSYIINALPPGKNYFRVRAFNTAYGSSSYSEELAGETTPPKAPVITDLKVLSTGSVTVVWAGFSNNGTSFHIERMEEGGTFREIARTGPGITQYTDKGLKASKRYFYRMRAGNEAGFSPYSSVSSGYTKAAPVFTDCADLGEYKTAIEDLSSRGLFPAKEDSSFAPYDDITRGEMVYWIIKAFDLKKTPVGSFTDVKADHPFYGEIITAKRYGLIEEDSTGSFHPENILTREEACLLISRTLRAVGKPLAGYSETELQKFSDAGSIETENIPGMLSCLKEQIIHPVKGNLIAPWYPVSRMEAAMMLYKIIDRQDITKP